MKKTIVKLLLKMKWFRQEIRNQMYNKPSYFNRPIVKIEDREVIKVQSYYQISRQDLIFTRGEIIKDMEEGFIKDNLFNHLKQNGFIKRKVVDNPTGSRTIFYELDVVKPKTN